MLVLAHLLDQEHNLVDVQVVLLHLVLIVHNEFVDLLLDGLESILILQILHCLVQVLQLRQAFLQQLDELLKCLEHLEKISELAIYLTQCVNAALREEEMYINLDAFLDLNNKEFMDLPEEYIHQFL